MALDGNLAREIKRAAPDRGNRAAYFEFAAKVRAAKNDMSNAGVREHFGELLVKHGRPVTAIVIAATLWERQKRLGGWNAAWARDVLDCWPHTPGLLEDAAIQDGLHPSRICEYAGSFIQANTER